MACGTKPTVLKQSIFQSRGKIGIYLDDPNICDKLMLIQAVSSSLGLRKGTFNNQEV